MKTKLLQIRVDDDFLAKLHYLQRINDYKSTADTVRKLIEKEFMKETTVLVNSEKDVFNYPILSKQREEQIREVLKRNRFTE